MRQHQFQVNAVFGSGLEAKVHGTNHQGFRAAHNCRISALYRQLVQQATLADG